MRPCNFQMSNVMCSHKIERMNKIVTAICQCFFYMLSVKCALVINPNRIIAMELIPKTLAKNKPVNCGYRKRKIDLNSKTCK